MRLDSSAKARSLTNAAAFGAYRGRDCRVGPTIQTNLKIHDG